MNSRTSTNKGKKRPTNNSNVKKKSVGSSTNAMPKKKKVVTSNAKKKGNAVQTKKKTITKEAPKKKNVQKVNKVNQKNTKKDVKNVKNVKKVQLYNNTEPKDIEYIDVEGFEEYNEPKIVDSNKKKIQKAKIENERKIKENVIISPHVIVTISFIIAIVITGGYLMLNLEYFNLSNIKVVGNTKYTSEKIIDNCSLKIGNNIFKELVSKDYNKYEIPYVSYLKYSYSFPNEIIVEVEERYPEYVAKDKNSEKFYMLDNQGYILEECTFETKGDTLFVEGLAFEENVNYGSQINEVYLKKLQKYKEIKQLLKEAEISTNITKVNFNASLTTITIDDKLNVVFSNDSNLRYRVSFLKSIIKQNGSLDEGTIDMSLENPVYSKYN